MVLLRDVCFSSRSFQKQSIENKNLNGRKEHIGEKNLQSAADDTLVFASWSPESRRQHCAAKCWPPRPDRCCSSDTNWRSSSSPSFAARNTSQIYSWSSFLFRSGFWQFPSSWNSVWPSRSRARLSPHAQACPGWPGWFGFESGRHFLSNHGDSGDDQVSNL